MWSPLGPSLFFFFRWNLRVCGALSYSIPIIPVKVPQSLVLGYSRSDNVFGCRAGDTQLATYNSAFSTTLALAYFLFDISQFPFGKVSAFGGKRNCSVTYRVPPRPAIQRVMRGKASQETVVRKSCTVIAIEVTTLRGAPYATEWPGQLYRWPERQSSKNISADFPHYFGVNRCFSEHIWVLFSVYKQPLVQVLPYPFHVLPVLNNSLLIG